MKNVSFPIFLMLSLLLFCCSKDATTETEQDGMEEPTPLEAYFPPTDSYTWETIAMADLGWNTNAEQELYTLLADNDTKAFIILKDGRIALEWYSTDFTKDSPWYWASSGKTLTCFVTGIAEEEGFLELTDKSSDYLGAGWTSAPTEKEDMITVWNQLTMTTGLDDTQGDCKTPDCLTYVADAGTRWAYHNAPYTLIQDVVSNATQTDFEDYFTSKLKDRIGMSGSWISTNGLNNVYWSTARSMARFGLLTLNDGIWDGSTILGAGDYLTAMKNTSQDLNKSYGYLWWLNGKESAMVPQSQIVFDTELIPNAPNDLFAGLGKNDQKLYIVPSQNLVVVRLGEDTGGAALGPSGFDNVLWGVLSEVIN